MWSYSVVVRPRAEATSAAVSATVGFIGTTPGESIAGSGGRSSRDRRLVGGDPFTGSGEEGEPVVASQGGVGGPFRVRHDPEDPARVVEERGGAARGAGRSVLVHQRHPVGDGASPLGGVVGAFAAGDGESHLGAGGG